MRGSRNSRRSWISLQRRLTIRACRRRRGRRLPNPPSPNRMRDRTGRFILIQRGVIRFSPAAAKAAAHMCAASCRVRARPTSASKSPRSNPMRRRSRYTAASVRVAPGASRPSRRLEISEGALVNILQARSKLFAKQTSLLKLRPLSGTALASDETGIRVGKANWWLWVFHDGDTAVFIVDAHRAPNRSCRPFCANGGRIIGFRIVSAARPAARRRNSNSASPTSSVTYNTRSTREIRCSGRA